MKCETDKGYGGFYPEIIEENKYIYISDISIANFLGLELEEYIDFIIENGGFLVEDCYFFETKEKCQKFIEEFIDPRLVMQELTK